LSVCSELAKPRCTFVCVAWIWLCYAGEPAAGLLCLVSRACISTWTEAAGFERWLIGHAGELAGARIDIAVLRDRAQRLLPAISMAGANVLSAWLDGLDAGEA
jgi:hypothetical protein